MKRSVFIFHRDLRFQDNTALHRAVDASSEVLPVFIFDPKQCDPTKNDYFSAAAFQFICESLQDLPLIHTFKGDTVSILTKIKKHYNFDAVYQNEDYSVFATNQHIQIASWCNKNDVKFSMAEDYGLTPIRSFLRNNENPYVVMSAFYKRCIAENVVRPVDDRDIPLSKLYKHQLPFEVDIQDILSKLPNSAKSPHQSGGRKEGLKVLERRLPNYGTERDIPGIQGTTRASAHLRFGTVSIREMYWAHVDNAPLIRELYFREFYLKIYAVSPQLQRGVAFNTEVDTRIVWENKFFEEWKAGKTGFPIVDAGMRQLSTEHWCHNRVRMIVASVATKYFLIDWRICAKYFYTQLVDADTFSNTAGWGWASSTGVDPAPFFRPPFNPFLQSAKFDKDAAYIKKYVPELRDVDAKDIHKWYLSQVREKYPSVKYGAPVVDYKQASAKAIAMFSGRRAV